MNLTIIAADFARREYQSLVESLETERAAFRSEAASRGLGRRAQHQYPGHIMHDLPDFVEWLAEYTTCLVNSHGSSNVNIDL